MAASPLSEVTILYDDSCGLCTGAKAWLATQPAFIPLRFVPAGSDEARRRFREVRPDELAVIADTGEVWMGNRAWIVCLWALRDYRDLAFRLTNPLLSGMAREAFSVLSAHRGSLSVMLGLRNEREMEQVLRKVFLPACRPERQ